MEFEPKDVEPFVAFERKGWERAAMAYHDHWGDLSSQSADAMLDAARVRAGTKVLDVATGAGYVAAKARERGAIATGLDFSDAQVTLARQTFPDVAFRQGDAQALPFDADTFDAVVMGFGMNHLPEPDVAAREAWRVLKPGGAFAFTVWSDPRPGEGFGIVLSAIEKYGHPEARLPPAPPYFRFADEREVHAVLSRAGFGGISTRTVPQVWLHEAEHQLFDAFNEGAVRATAMLRAQPEAVRDRIRGAVIAEVTTLREGCGFRISVPASLSVGTKA